MWNNWIETGRSIAERAKVAAEGIEAQLNDSVGIIDNSSHKSNLDERIDEEQEQFDDLDDQLHVEDDSFYDDNEDFTVPIKSNVSFQASTPNSTKNDVDDKNLAALENVQELEEKEEEEEEEGWNLADDEIVFDDNEDYDEQDDHVDSDNSENTKKSNNVLLFEQDNEKTNLQEFNDLPHVNSVHNNDENNENDHHDENKLEIQKDKNEHLIDSTITYIDEKNEIINHDDIDDDHVEENIATKTETIDCKGENSESREDDDQVNPSVGPKESSNEFLDKKNQPNDDEEKDTPVDIDANSRVSCESESNSTTELSEHQNQLTTNLPNETPVPIHNDQPQINSTKTKLGVASSLDDFEVTLTTEPDTVIVTDSGMDKSGNAEIRNDSDNEKSNEVVDINSKKIIDHQNLKIADLESQIKSLLNTLQTREQQLEANSEKIVTLQNLHENEKISLLTVVKETKEEAKKRMLKAKERTEEMQNRLKTVSRDLDFERQKQNATKNSNADKDIIIEELRKEGESLAQKQGTLTENFRKAQKESKELRLQVNDLTEKVRQHENTITSQKQERENFEKELKKLDQYKEQVEKLSSDLNKAKEESEQLKVLKLSLDDKIKELKKEHSNYLKESSEQQAQTSEKMKSHEKSVQREKDEFMSDMENKLATVEKESNMREDALRRELEDLRRRWQDAVQRADVLSMDVQQSTAPLIRQLESAERTYRIRASAWTELEQKLRSDLEDSVIENEDLFKEMTELQTRNNKNERQLKLKETQMESISNERNDLTKQVLELEKKFRASKVDGEKLKVKCDEIERLSQESVSKARNEMMETILKSDSLHKEEIDELQRKLINAEEENSKLKEKIEDVLESSSTIIKETSFKRQTSNSVGIVTNQASILESTLLGLDNEVGEDSDDGDFGNDDISDIKSPPTNTSSSFVAIEQLTQAVRASKLELNALREQLAISEEARIALQEELASARIAAEKLPMFEERVQQLTAELHEKQLDIDEMRENMREVKEMYRSQLDNLLEEKVANINYTEDISAEY